MSVSPEICITRDPDPIVLDGIRAPTLAALRAVLVSPAAGPGPLVSDLSLGAWRSHQVAAEFAAQLGITLPGAPPPPLQPTPPAAAARSHGDLVGARIDAETRGDRIVLVALELATRLIAAVAAGAPPTLLVLAPRFGLPWEPENIAFLRFLAQGLRGRSTHLVLAATDADDPPLPPGWTVRWRDAPGPAAGAAEKSLLGLVPGVVAPEIAAALDGGAGIATAQALPLAGGHRLLAPECRRPPAAVPPPEYDRLAAAVQPFAWLAAYAQCHGSPTQADPAVLSAEGRQRFAEGGCAIALRLLERAVACATAPAEQGVFLAQLQGMRITLQRYQELVEAPDPSADLWPALRAILLEAKGWGLAMLDAAERAEPYFLEAQQLLGRDRYNREYLYLLNIMALNHLKLGDAAGALALERSIEVTLARQPRRDWHLEYINAINLARLYRRARQFHEAERYYQRAFATTQGIRSENDTLYVNVCLARLDQERGAVDEALLHWLRAGLHWVSNSVPEGLSSRVAGAILSRKPAPDESLPEAISGALEVLLRDTSRAADHGPAPAVLDQDLDALPAPVFVRSDRLPAAASPPVIECAVGAPGWSVLATNLSLPAPFAGAQHRRLCALLYALLQARAATEELANRATLVVDDRLGDEMARTRAELYDTCLRLDVPRMVFAGEIVELDQEVRAELAWQSRVQPGSAVAELQFADGSATVHFKRYRAPLVLTGADAQLLAALPGDRPLLLAELADRLGGGDHPDRVLAAARRLEQARVLAFHLAEDVYVPPRLVSSRL
jgi:tetratricopeptide (TPR) repeat protein